MSKAIDPRLPSGFMDIDPALAVQRQQMIEIIERQYRLMGSQPLVTPAVEYEDVLIGGEDFSKQLYRVVRRGAEDGEDEEKNPLALRFDLTVPLARYVASHPELPMPFIRHQLGQVWRGERKQQGRYHEFTQFDLDIVGTSSLAADAQVMATMYNVLRSLGVERFVIKFNHRGLFNVKPDILQALDKYDRIGWEGVRSLLAEENMNSENIGRVEAYLKQGLDETTGLLLSDDTLQRVKSELQELKQSLSALGVSSEYCQFNPAIVRGLGYYTGPVWETVLLDAPEFGSVYSGGRYDNLLSRFGNRSLPATGTSIGVDRLFAALQKIGAMQATDAAAQVLVARFEDELVPEQLKIAAELRRAGIATELYLGKEKGLTQQVGYAKNRGIEVVVLYGAKEHAANEVAIKFLIAGEQKTVLRSSFIIEIQKLLETNN